jgi:hypothetical protein
MMRVGRELLAGVVMGLVIARTLCTGLDGAASAQPSNPEPTAPRDLQELARIYADDQGDRLPGDGKPINWSAVLPRDRAREARVKALYEAGELRTGEDYYRTAMVLQHATRPEDFLLAHELCVVAVSKGDRDARWLAAATEDRYLMNLGRPQRFGTQYRSTGPDKPVRLYEVGPGVTDALRRELNVPTLDEARTKEAQMEETIKGKKAGRQSHKLADSSFGNAPPWPDRGNEPSRMRAPIGGSSPAA